MGIPADQSISIIKHASVAPSLAGGSLLVGNVIGYAWEHVIRLAVQKAPDWGNVPELLRVGSLLKHQHCSKYKACAALRARGTFAQDGSSCRCTCPHTRWM
jgi:hypothetical protein